MGVISLDSALKKDNNYYPQVFLKECKYIEQEMVRYITENPEIAFDESNKE